MQEFVKEKPWGMKIALKKLEIQIRAASNNWYNRPKIRKSLEIKEGKTKKEGKFLIAMREVLSRQTHGLLSIAG